MAGGLLKTLFVCLCFQIVLCQFGYLQPREERRFPSTFGSSQNFFPNPSRIKDTISKIIQLEQEILLSNPAFIYPFQNRPITNPNQNPYSNNVWFPDREQTQFPNSNQLNNPGYPENSANVPSNDNNSGFTNYPTFTNTPNIEGELTSGQNYRPGFGWLSNIGNGGTESSKYGQQTGPVFGEGEANGSSGNLTPWQQNGPVFGKELPNFDNRISDTLVSGQQTGPVYSQYFPNTGGTLVSGQNYGPTFNTEASNFGNSGTDTLVSGQHTGPIFGSNIGNGEITLVSGEHTGNAFSTEARKFGSEGAGSLVFGQQTGPSFGHDVSNSNNDGSTLVSGQNNGPIFGTEAPNYGNSGISTLVSSQQTGPVFGQDLQNISFGGSGDLVSGQQNGSVFGIESPNNENKGVLITGKHSGPVPDTPLPNFESRNGSDQGIFKETCTTVEGGIGTCIPIVTCAPYVTLVQQEKTNPAAVRHLRAAHCGFEGNKPKVCCPLPAPLTGPPISPPTDTPSGKSILNSDFITAFPEPPVCGFSNASFSRVVGGVNAKLGDFPWMTLLGYRGLQKSSTRWLCGGSLISQHHVLTAAHCINSREDLYVVRLGELDRARDDEGATPIDILIKSKIKHEKYNATSFGNDIGILVLERDVDFTSLIRPICIPTRADLRDNSFVDYNPLIAGWGDTEFHGQPALHLQALQLPVLENSYCVQAYSNYTAQVIDDRVMCAGFKEGGKDSCQGDSGGPLMQPIANPVEFRSYFYQTGVVSFGRRCAEAGFPGIYTRVTYFLPWIQKQVLGLTGPTETPSGKSILNSDFITAFPEPPVCGFSNASFSRVVGGVNAKLGDFPWMTLLGYRGPQNSSTRWLCGGSLISQHHVLTAAHCINSREDLYVVRFGELDRARDDEGATPIDILIKNKIKHEKYNATSFGNDIGILVLERDVDFTSLIKPICIPTRADLRANSFVDYNPLIAGWGDTEFHGQPALHLQALQLPVLENSYCVQAYSNYTAQVIDDRVMCAGFKEGGKDSCQGDSGGPLMQPIYNPVEFSTYFYQTGVVSFGRRCAEAGFPGIYTRVTYFVPWLHKQVLGLTE